MSSPTPASDWGRSSRSAREDFDGETLQIRRTAHEGQILEGTKTDHGELDAGRIVPVPATLAWMLDAQLQVSNDAELLFRTPTGRMWRERNFYRDLWRPAQEASGLWRHSWGRYTHAVGGNFAAVRSVVG